MAGGDGEREGEPDAADALDQLVDADAEDDAVPLDAQDPSRKKYSNLGLQ